MSTPATPATPTLETEVKAIEKRIGIWLDPAHIVLTVLLVGALLAGTYFFVSKRADIAEARAEAAEQVLKVAQQAAITSQQQNAIQQEQSKALEAQMAAANQQLATANAQLQAANSQLKSALAAQQKQDAALTPQDQAARWTQLVPTAKVTVTTSGFSVDPQGGLDTIQALEELPFDRKTISNLQTELSNDAKTIANDAVSLSAEKTAHESDVANAAKQVAAANDKAKAIQAEYDAYKKKAHRNYFRIFFAGAIFGAIGAHAAGI